MDRTTDPRRPTAVRRPRVGALLVLSLGLAAIVPWPVSAADESAPPAEVSPPPEPTPDATSQPTPEPTLEPTPDPTPAPTENSQPAAVGTPEPEPTPTGQPAPTLAPTPAPTPILNRFLLYRPGAVVRQYTNYWCVPATTQSMLNLIQGKSDRSYATQRRLYNGIRKNNRYTYRTKGNDPQGWAWGLRYYSGYTRAYTARSYENKLRAMWAIHDSISRTKEPVGITVRNGTHAWVVLGYRSTADPSEPSKRTLLGFYVTGPLGAARDPWPYKYLKLADFRREFSMYHEWQRKVIWEDEWVVIAQ